jgi:hypothetical protein
MLEALAASAPAVFLRTSFLAYPLVNTLHILAIGVLVTSAALMDLRVLGIAPAIPAESVIRYLRPAAIGALAAAALSGLALFSVQPLDYWDNPAFRAKMLILAAALANAALFTSFRAHRRPGRPATVIMAAASIALWLSVVVCGRFIGFLA